MRLLAMAAAILASACTGNEQLRRNFRYEIDQCVGAMFMDSGRWGCRWGDAIEKREVGATADEYLIAPDFMGKCRWTYVVDRDTRRVTAWRYASGQGDCYIRFDWLGPW
jgi:hypothetical protein